MQAKQLLCHIVSLFSLFPSFASIFHFLSSDARSKQRTGRRTLGSCCPTPEWLLFWRKRPKYKYACQSGEHITKFTGKWFISWENVWLSKVIVLISDEWLPAVQKSWQPVSLSRQSSDQRLDCRSAQSGCDTCLGSWQHSAVTRFSSRAGSKRKFPPSIAVLTNDLRFTASHGRLEWFDPLDSSLICRSTFW